MFDESSSIEEVRDFFANDLFASEACGCRVLEASHGHAVCAFDIADIHRNAQGNVMGGAIYTLADFALAVACNMGENPTLSVTSTIEYLSATRGSTLTATCEADKSGRTLGFYTTDVVDDLGVHIARMTSTCYRMR